MKFSTRMAVHFFIVTSISFSTVKGQGPMITSRSANSNTMVSRTPDSRGWTDPALNHNKLLQQQTTEGTYTLIGTYKVVGNPYLFGQHHKGDMYAPDARAQNIYLSYNTYNQEVEFYSSSNPDKSLVKEPGTLDSFTIQENKELGIACPLKFVYGAVVGSKEKKYFQEVCKGERFSLYKLYTSDLGYSSTNIAQSELRQFDLQYEYFYTDSENKEPKKIKPNAASVIKEFKRVTDLSGEIKNEDFTGNPETAFCKVFSSLNQLKRGY
ncbi:MAG: hypothetical protein ABI688_08820 [Bacteroidota bacterium]